MLLYPDKDSGDGIYTFSVQGRRMRLQKFTVKDNFPMWEFLGSKETFDVKNNPVSITIQHIVENTNGGEWTGTAKDIISYNEENNLPMISKNINKNTFSRDFIHQLSTLGIRYKAVKNGNGIMHRFKKM